ncbi:MAG: hypothetical protein WB239_12620, partial [Acidimicrobiia bacterium]
IVGRGGIYGVFLNVDPEDFGFEETQRPPMGEGAGQLRSGLSEAMESDASDDSYDLSWMGSLPADTAKRIPKLRKLLGAERDPIDRHFMFTQLEHDLYSCRDLWESAFDEYDDVTEHHHTEMVANIRDALFEKFGQVPLIEMYKQAAIRNQKARRWERSLEWAQRGLAVYGDDAARPEAVEDLRMRVERAKSKLG